MKIIKNKAQDSSKTEEKNLEWQEGSWNITTDDKSNHGKYSFDRAEKAHF